MDQNHEPKRIFTFLLLLDIMVTALTSYSENQPQGLQIDPIEGVVLHTEKPLATGSCQELSQSPLGSLVLKAAHPGFTPILLRCVVPGTPRNSLSR